MRNTGSILLLAALAATFTAAPRAEARSPKPAKRTNLTGTVTKINAPTKSFVLHTHQGWGKKAHDAEFTVVTTAGTTFKRAGKLIVTRKPAAFADLAVNETVQVKGLPAKDGKVGATDILIKREPKK